MLRAYIFISILTMFFFTGCVNRRGISATYYNDCDEYYDARGYYHKVCDKNIISYKDIKRGFFKKPKPRGNVW